MSKRKSARRLTGQAAAIYSRVSTGEQVGRGGLVSCDAQDATNRGWASEQGLCVVAAYRDEGRTGTNLQRPGWRALLAAAQRGEFRVVIVTYMDRLGRGDEFVIARYELEKAGVHVVMSQEQFADDLGGYFAENMTRTLGGAYAKEISRKTKGKMAQMIAAGLWPGGKPSYGFLTVAATDFPAGDRSHPTRLVIDPERAPHVRAAFEAAIPHGRLSIVQDVLLTLTDRGWDSAQVRRLLTNPIYAGRLVWGDVEVADYCAPIVAPELWGQVQSALQRAPAEPRRLRREATIVPKESYLFTGRILCGRCQGRMTPYWTRSRHGGIYTYYECYNSRQGICSQARVSAPRLHDAFGEAVAAPPWRVRKLMEAASALAPDTRAAQKALADAIRSQKAAQAQVDRLTLAIGQTDDPGAMAALVARLTAEAKRAREAGEEVARARAELGRSGQRFSVAELTQQLAAVRDLWGPATDLEKRELVGYVLESVTVEGPLARFELRHVPEICGATGGDLDEKREARTRVPDSTKPSPVRPHTTVPILVQVGTLRCSASRRS